MSVDFSPVFIPEIDVLHYVVKCFVCDLTDGREYASYADASAVAYADEPVLCPDPACGSHRYADRMQADSVVSELVSTRLNVANGNAYRLLMELGFDESTDIYGSCSAAEMAQRLETHPLSNRHYFERLFEVVRAATALGRDVQWC